MSKGTRQEKEKLLEVKVLVKEAITELFADGQFIDIITQKIIGKVNEKISQIDTKIQAQNEKLTILEKRIENMEQNEKKNNVCIYGLKENNNMQFKELVLETINNKLQIVASTKDIERCYRIGKSTENEEKTRPAIIKLANYSMKQNILRNCGKLKGTKLFVTEDLTKERHDLLKSAQEKFGKKFVFTYSGSVYFRCQDQKVKINSKEDILRYNI